MLPWILDEAKLGVWLVESMISLVTESGPKGDEVVVLAIKNQVAVEH